MVCVCVCVCIPNEEELIFRSALSGSHLLQQSRLNRLGQKTEPGRGLAGNCSRLWELRLLVIEEESCFGVIIRAHSQSFA